MGPAAMLKPTCAVAQISAKHPTPQPKTSTWPTRFSSTFSCDFFLYGLILRTRTTKQKCHSESNFPLCLQLSKHASRQTHPLTRPSLSSVSNPGGPSSDSSSDSSLSPAPRSLKISTVSAEHSLKPGDFTAGRRFVQSTFGICGVDSASARDSTEASNKKHRIMVFKWISGSFAVRGFRGACSDLLSRSLSPPGELSLHPSVLSTCSKTFKNSSGTKCTDKVIRPHLIWTWSQWDGLCYGATIKEYLKSVYLQY